MSHACGCNNLAHEGRGGVCAVHQHTAATEACHGLDVEIQDYHANVASGWCSCLPAPSPTELAGQTHVPQAAAGILIVGLAGQLHG